MQNRSKYKVDVSKKSRFVDITFKHGESGVPAGVSSGRDAVALFGPGNGALIHDVNQLGQSPTG